MSKLASIETFTLKQITDKVNDTYNLAEARITWDVINEILNTTALTDDQRQLFNANVTDLKRRLGGQRCQAKLNVLLRSCRHSYYRPDQKLGYAHIFNRAMANQLAQKFMKYAVIDLVHRGYYHHGDNQLSIHTRLTHRQFKADLKAVIKAMPGDEIEQQTKQAALLEFMTPLLNQKNFTYQNVMTILKRHKSDHWTIGLRIAYTKRLK